MSNKPENKESYKGGSNRSNDNRENFTVQNRPPIQQTYKPEQGKENKSSANSSGSSNKE